MSKIQNSIWIKNTNKTGQETMNLLKLLKEIGVLKPSVSSAMNKDSHLIKDKRTGKRSKIDKRKVVAADAIGKGRGGGAGGGGLIIAPPNVSDVDNALSVLKSGISSTAYKEQQLKQLKDETELAVGKLRDAQQDLQMIQSRPNFGFPKRSEFGVGSGPKQDFIEDIDESVKYFPDKEVVVAPTNYEMNREGASVNIPDEVMEQDVSAQVNPEQGIIEDIDEEEYINPKQPTKGINEFQLAIDYLRNSNKYNIKRLPTFQESNKTKFDIYMELLNSLGIKKPTGPPYRSSTSSVLDPALRQLIIRAYRDDMEEVD